MKLAFDFNILTQNQRKPSLWSQNMWTRSLDACDEDRRHKGDSKQNDYDNNKDDQSTLI